MGAFKKKITFRLDTEVLQEFKRMTPDGKGYLNLINQALREWLSAQGVKELVREELAELGGGGYGNDKRRQPRRLHEKKHTDLAWLRSGMQRWSSSE